MRHAMCKKAVLLADNLAGHFQDRARPLVKRLDEPGRRRRAFGDEFLLLLAHRQRGDFGIIGLVHQHARQRFGIELDRVHAVRQLADIHIRRDRHGRVARKSSAGFRRQLAQFKQHVLDVGLVDAAHIHQRFQVVPGHERQIVEHRLHRRVHAAAVAQLQGKAFGNRARHHAGRVKALADAEHGLDIRDVGAERFCDILERRTQVAGLVRLVDQPRGNQPVGARKACEVQLHVQVFGQRHIAGKVRGIVKIFRGLTTSGARPVGRRGRAGRVRGHGRVGSRAGLVDIFAGRIELVARLALGGRVALFARLAALRLDGFRRRCRLAFDLHQQRVTFELGLDEFGELLIRKLKEFDRLLQLRRHHQGLSLAHVE